MWQCKCKPIRLTLPQQVISASLHFVWRRRRVVIKGWLRGSLNLLTSGQPNSTCFVWIQRWSQNQNRWTQLGCAVGGCWNKSVLITVCIVRLCHPWQADVCLGFGLCFDRILVCVCSFGKADQCDLTVECLPYLWLEKWLSFWLRWVK